MNRNIFILHSATLRVPQELIELLENTLSHHANDAMKDFGIETVNVTVYFTDKDITHGVGVSGYTPYQDWIQVKIDPTGPNFREVIEKHLPATIYHEMHHAARWASVGYGKSLDEVLVTEGLATVYQEDKWSEYDVPWGTYSDDEIKNLVEIYKKRGGEDPTYGNAAHSKWFFGSTPEIPKWFGYKLGTHIIREAKRINPGTLARDLVSTDAKKVLLLAGIS